MLRVVFSSAADVDHMANYGITSRVEMRMCGLELTELGVGRYRALNSYLEMRNEMAFSGGQKNEQDNRIRIT